MLYGIKRIIAINISNDLKVLSKYIGAILLNVDILIPWIYNFFV